MRPSLSPTLECKPLRTPLFGTYARNPSAAIITKDRDFAQRKALHDGGAVVIWIRLPNTRRRDLLTWFDTILPDVLAAVERGETLVEVT